MDYTIRFCCLSDTGKVRQNNEDNLICLGRYFDPDSAEPRTPLRGRRDAAGAPVFGVFDGMGGEEQGEVASHIAARTAAEYAFDGPGALDGFCREANRRICAYAEANGITTMGTTAALLRFTGEGAAACNLGDSPIFHWREGTLRQISRDHVMPVPGARKPPLVQYLGIPEDEMRLEPTLSLTPVLPGDRFLICSDGLTDMVGPDAIAEMLREDDVDAACKRLMDMALDAGGRDNTTILLCAIEEKPVGAGRRLTRFVKGLFSRGRN